MRIVVTGSAGFIASNFVYYYLDVHPDDELIGFDALTYAGNIKTIESALQNKRFTFIKGDITDKNAVDDLFRRKTPDVIINFAAESHVDRSIVNSYVFLRTNINGTQILLEACRKFGIQRFHQISTDEVYGDLPLNCNDLFTEQSPMRASSPYSASKASADLLALSYHRTYGLPVSISRSSNNYGPYQLLEKFIPRMIANALNDMELPVYGNGENIRDWIHVHDHCRAVDIIIHNGQIGEVYNVGANTKVRNISIVKMILNKLGKPESLIKFVSDRPGHDLRYAIDTTKICNELGWESEMDFQEGIAQTIQWYIDNKMWWSKMK
mgnify:FL=1